MNGTALPSHIVPRFGRRATDDERRTIQRMLEGREGKQPTLLPEYTFVQQVSRNPLRNGTAWRIMESDTLQAAVRMLRANRDSADTWHFLRWNTRRPVDRAVDLFEKSVRKGTLRRAGEDAYEDPKTGGQVIRLSEGGLLFKVPLSIDLLPVWFVLKHSRPKA